MSEDIKREIGSKTREFYEFVLPPIDMYMDQDSLVLLADMPGFEKEDIRVSLKARTIRIQACKKRADRDGGARQENAEDGHHEDRQERTVYAQRPNIIDKEIRLPAVSRFRSRDGSDGESTEDRRPAAKYEAGVLRVTIPIRKTGMDIEVQ